MTLFILLCTRYRENFVILQRLLSFVVVLSSNLLAEGTAAVLTPAINCIAFGILAHQCLRIPSGKIYLPYGREGGDIHGNFFKYECPCGKPGCVDGLRVCNIPAICYLKGFYYILFAYTSLVAFFAAAFLENPAGTWVPYYILVGGSVLLSLGLVVYAWSQGLPCRFVGKDSGHSA